ncbi:putative RNA polymerase II subunit B1 CTD phosphatase RPAP2 [Taenia solium]|eukprot:TsM_000056300 transcript=TsM_000056300 gene=TsM_000056300
MAEDFELREPKEADKGPFQASRADFETTRRRKALCLKNALTIVERFGMNPVSKEMVALALPWLEREQYDDIPVERVGYGNCGYPLCLKTASATQFKQQYRISVARRRVYEVGDRKYFCSDWCYRASCYLRRQIPKEPAWCRPLPTGPMLGIKFLPPNMPGRPGKTILDALYHLRLNDDIQNEGERGEFSSSEAESEGGDTSNKGTDEGSSLSELDENVVDEENRRVKPSPTPWNETIPQPTSTKITERKNVTVSKAKNPPKQITIERREAREEVKTTSAEIVLARLQEWLTKEAVEVLFNQECCTSTTSRSPSPLPCEEEPLPVVMPLVESVSQHSYRLRLVMESLLPSLKKILFRLETPLSSVYEKLQNVLAKFNLTNRNLHLRPHEASLMCLCLLHLLADDDTLYPHDRLVEMVTTFNGVTDNAEGFLASISELAQKLREESLDSPS